MSGPFGSSQTFFGDSGDFQINHSLKFDGVTNSKIHITPGSAGSARIGTFSVWVKKLKQGAFQQVFAAGDATTDTVELLFRNNDQLLLTAAVGNATKMQLKTNTKFRDCSGWYHLFFAIDTTQGTAANRVKLYVNGVIQSDFETENYPDQNQDLDISQAVEHMLGVNVVNNNNLNGYLAEANFIDGLALTPTSFGVTDETYGHWKPIQYTGAYGTNGFNVRFEDSGNLGHDANGGTDLTETNVAATDQSLDSPTNTFPVLNHLSAAGDSLISEAGLKISSVNGLNGAGGIVATMELPHSGKWYWEVHALAIDNDRPNLYIGLDEGRVLDHRIINTIGSGAIATSRVYQSNGNGTKTSNNESAYGGTWSDGDVIGVMVDMDAGKVYYRRNDTIESSGAAAFTIGVNTSSFIPSFAVYEDAASADGGNVMTINFGQDSSFAAGLTSVGAQDENGIGDFKYTPPAGYVAFCTKNLPEPQCVPKDNFGIVGYTGTGVNGAAENVITGLEFQPDTVWIKDRASTGEHQIVNSLAGSARYKSPSSAEAEGNRSTRVKRFTSDGFALGDGNGTNGSNANVNNATYKAWCWRNSTDFDTSASGSGVNKTPATTAHINVDAGQGVMLWEGDGEGFEPRHGLSKYTDYPMGMTLFVGKRNANASWAVFHTYGFDASDYLVLDTDAASVDNSTFWNDQNVDNTKFQIMSADSVGADDDTYVCYYWHDVEGYSRFSNYIGNGNVDGTFVPTGFRPSLVIVKKLDAAHNWPMVDDFTMPFNKDQTIFSESDTTDAEDTDPCIDMLSNGFKVRDTAARYNSDGSTYAFWAWASLPAKYNNAR